MPSYVISSGGVSEVERSPEIVSSVRLQLMYPYFKSSSFFEIRVFFYLKIINILCENTISFIELIVLLFNCVL